MTAEGFVRYWIGLLAKECLCYSCTNRERWAKARAAYSEVHRLACQRAEIKALGIPADTWGG